MKIIKRYLFLLHRWLGIATCLLFLLWFASGIVMMYVPYPALTEDERLQSLPELDPSRIQFNVQDAVAALPEGSALDALTISSVLHRPAYHLRGSGGESITLFADDGSRFAGLSVAEAEQVATDFRAGKIARYLELIQMDQWTVASGLNTLRPLHKVAIDDGAGTVVYVSEINGQIVRDTAAAERFWNWLGSTIHWIYPKQLRQHPALWADVVIYLSLAGMVVLLTGLYVGIQRLRIRQRYKGDRVTPYQGWQKWHHLLGLIASVFLVTFMLSGLLSMNPWGVFNNSTSAREQIARFTGGSLRVDEAQHILETLTFEEAQGLKELEWMQMDGEGYFVARYSAADSRVLLADQGLAEDFTSRIESTIPKLLPTADILSLEVLTSYDDYYYGRHNRHRPLPVYRVKFADEAATWFHIDATTGKVLNRLTAKDRVQRWLYKGLHSLDFHFLITRRPLWDIVVIVLSMVGIVFSATGIVLGWRRLVAWQGRRVSRRRRAEALQS